MSRLPVVPIAGTDARQGTFGTLAGREDGEGHLALDDRRVSATRGRFRSEEAQLFRRRLARTPGVAFVAIIAGCVTSSVLRYGLQAGWLVTNAGGIAGAILAMVIGNVLVRRFSRTGPNEEPS